MQARFGDQWRIHLDAINWSGSMRELCHHLFTGPERTSDVLQWQNVNTALHNALLETVGSTNACSMCNDLRNLQDPRKYCQDWSFKARRLIWNLTVNTIHKYGSGWQVWRESETMATNDTEHGDSTDQTMQTRAWPRWSTARGCTRGTVCTNNSAWGGVSVL